MNFGSQEYTRIAIKFGGIEFTWVKLGSQVHIGLSLEFLDPWEL